MMMVQTHRQVVALLQNYAQLQTSIAGHHLAGRNNKHLHIILTKRLVSCEINVPFYQKIGYIRDKVLGGDLVLSG